MLWKPPWAEEHHCKIISLSDPLLILIPLLITFQPRDRRRSLVQSVLYPGTWVWHQALPRCSLWDWTNHLFIPLCLTTLTLDFLLHGLFNIYFYAFLNKGFLLVWVAHSLCCRGGNPEFRLKWATRKSWCVGSVYDTFLVTTLCRWTQIFFLN